MTNNNKNSNGPKTDEGKAISSRNSVTHGLTARHWLNVDEQSLYDETVKNLIVDFDPQTSIEKMLITKMAECSVRLMRIQNRENAMFDLASNEAENVIEAIKSLSNGHKLDPRLIDSMVTARLGNPTNNPRIIEDKVRLMDEIDFQNLSDVSGWGYVEKHMPMVESYINKKCVEEDLDLYSFIFRETDDSINLNKKVILLGVPSPEIEVIHSPNKIQSTLLQRYLEQLSRNLGSDIQAQMTLNNVEKRSQQVKDAAIPNAQELNLIQRYRTANERQFSKTLGELLELQKRRKNA
jgi:hypothetical protein